MKIVLFHSFIATLLITSTYFCVPTSRVRFSKINRRPFLPISAQHSGCCDNSSIAATNPSKSPALVNTPQSFAVPESVPELVEGPVEGPPSTISFSSPSSKLASTARPLDIMLQVLLGMAAPPSPGLQATMHFEPPEKLSIFQNTSSKTLSVNSPNKGPLLNWFKLIPPLRILASIRTGSLVLSMAISHETNLK